MRSSAATSICCVVDCRRFILRFCRNCGWFLQRQFPQPLAAMLSAQFARPFCRMASVALPRKVSITGIYVG